MDDSGRGINNHMVLIGPGVTRANLIARQAAEALLPALIVVAMVAYVASRDNPTW